MVVFLITCLTMGTMTRTSRHIGSFRASIDMTLVGLRWTFLTWANLGSVELAFAVIDRRDSNEVNSMALKERAEAQLEFD